jgi:hypothetical protein
MASPPTSAELPGYVPFHYPRRVTSIDTDTRVDQRPDVVPTDDGDHERFSHYADRDRITEAMVTGAPVVALCGKVWVPSRDPKKYPVCPDCKRLFDLGPEGRKREWKERNQ